MPRDSIRASSSVLLAGLPPLGGTMLRRATRPSSETPICIEASTHCAISTASTDSAALYWAIRRRIGSGRICSSA